MAAALAGLAVAVILVTWATIGSAAQPLWEWVTGAYLVALPLATGASILRYRLYDLDRIISRTLAYALLTVLLGLGYAAVALVLGQLLGRDSSLAVAGATLAVAATFQPARRRVQATVDRRFNRAAATTPPAPSAPSAPGCATRSTWTPCRRAAGRCRPDHAAHHGDARQPRP